MTILYNVWLDRTKFTYELDDHRVARVWADLMKPLSVTSLQQGADPWHGRISSLDKRVNEFNFLIDAINLWIPNKIPGHFDATDPQASLNRLHVHFPEQHYVETDLGHLDQLRRYNSLLHQIEKIYRSIETIKTPGADEKITILAAQAQPTCVPLEPEDYKLFTTNFRFGDLMLHYPHVGRHPFEILTSKDTDCPQEQILCQTDISASHTMWFYHSYVSPGEFKEFYTNSKITWPYSVDNPQLAVGYIRLGRLIEVNYEPPFHHKTLELVKQATKITNWQIFDQNQQAEDSDDTN
jgi:hypothetical protein